MGFDLRPRTAAGRRGVWILALMSPGLVGGVVSLRGWWGLTVFLGLAVLVGLPWLVWATTRQVSPYAEKTFTPLSYRLWRADAGTVAGPLLVLSVMVFGLAMFFGARAAALDLWGSPAKARVDRVDEDRDERQHRGSDRVTVTYDVCFRLSRPDGSSGFGRICRDGHEYRVGSWIDVLAEPAGLVALDTPDAVAEARPWFFAMGGSFMVLLGYGWAIGGVPVPDQPPPVPVQRGMAPVRPRVPASVRQRRRRERQRRPHRR